MSEAEAIPVAHAAAHKLKPPDSGGFFKGIDWIKATKELGFPIVAGGFLLWKMSAFIDVGIKSQEKTADAVVSVSADLTTLKDADESKAKALWALKTTTEDNGTKTHELQNKMLERLDVSDKKSDTLIELTRSTGRILRKGLNVKKSDMDDDDPE